MSVLLLLLLCCSAKSTNIESEMLQSCRLLSDCNYAQPRFVFQFLLCNLARSLIKTPDKVERRGETENRSRNCQVAMTKPRRKRRRKSQTMKTFACCSLAGFPSYVFGFFRFLRFFRFSLIRHTHCCRHWCSVFSLSCSFSGSKLCGEFI